MVAAGAEAEGVEAAGPVVVEQAEAELEAAELEEVVKAAEVLVEERAAVELAAAGAVPEVQAGPPEEDTIPTRIPIIQRLISRGPSCRQS